MSLRTNALAMFSATVVGQALPLAVTPLLTRLYAPEAFGLQSLFMGWAGALGVLATLRFDLAIVLPRDENDARDIAAFVLTVTGIAAAATAALASVYVAAGADARAFWPLLLGPMVGAIGLAQIGSALATRADRFRRLAGATIANQLGYVVVALLLVLPGLSLLGLVAAKLIGQLMAVFALAWGANWHVGDLVRRISKERLQCVLRTYRKFLLFSTPYSFIGIVARETPVLLFSAWGQISAAGWYGLARTIMLAPTLLASGALSQVFFREAAARIGTPPLGRLTGQLLRGGLLASAPLFAFVVAWGDVAFEVIFGSRWKEAGVFAMLLATPAWLSLQTGWPERMFEVAQRQDVSFKVQVTSDAVTAAAVLTALASTGLPTVAVVAFAAANVLYHLAYLVAMFRVGGFSMPLLYRTLAQGWAFYAGCALLMAAIRQFDDAALRGGLVAMIVAVAVAAAVAVRMLRPLRPAAPSEPNS